MAPSLRKIASFFWPRLRKPQRARRSRSSTRESQSSSRHSSSPSAPSSRRSSHCSSTTPSGELSQRGSSKALVRLKSWFERTKSVAPEGFFNVDVGQEKVRYVVPITYLSHEDLQKLLDDSVAEFGHSYVGALQLSCDEDEFKEVLETIERSFRPGDDDTEGESQSLIAGKDESRLH